jgi:hypothetical protein
MGAIVIRTRFDEGTESVEVATSDYNVLQCPLKRVIIIYYFGTIKQKTNKSKFEDNLDRVTCHLW